jgi:hypothetical protein
MVVVVVVVVVVMVVMGARRLGRGPEPVLPRLMMAELLLSCIMCGSSSSNINSNGNIGSSSSSSSSQTPGCIAWIPAQARSWAVTAPQGAVVAAAAAAAVAAAAAQ